MARRRGFRPDISTWVVLEDLTGVKSAAEIFATSPSSERQEQIVELERMVGRVTMELGRHRSGLH